MRKSTTDVSISDIEGDVSVIGPIHSADGDLSIRSVMRYDPRKDAVRLSNYRVVRSLNGQDESLGCWRCVQDAIDHLNGMLERKDADR